VGWDREVRTELINVVLTPAKFIEDRICAKLLFAHAAPCLGHDNELVTGEIVLLNRLRDDALGISIRVDVCRIPL
jgi:hypothetical protein